MYKYVPMIDVRDHLSRRNAGYANTCQMVGQAVGSTAAYVGFIALDSKDFCNLFRSVPQDHGFVSMPGRSRSKSDT